MTVLWRTNAKPELAPKTSAEYERIANRILKPELGKIGIDKLTPVAVAGMYQRRRSKATQAALAVRVLSSAMSWAEEAGLRSPARTPPSIRLKGSRRRKQLFSDNEVSRLLGMIGEQEIAQKISPTAALALRLLFATGCRAGEICGLQWSNVDLDESVMRWPNSKTGFLEKPITAEARAVLDRADRTVEVDWVCPATNGKHMRVETLEAAFERVMKAAKVEAWENATLHLIRHWFATKTYTDKSIPLPIQMAIVGHSSVVTAMRYAHVGRDELRNAAAGAEERRADAVRAAGKLGEIVQHPASAGWKSPPDITGFSPSRSGWTTLTRPSAKRTRSI